MIVINPRVLALISLVAGVLILIFPDVLNYVVASYLILIGLFGLFGGAFKLPR